jgi:uncharacterized membrane protein YccC
VNWIQIGKGVYIVLACIGAAAAAVALKDPSLTMPAGTVAAACGAVVVTLGGFLPSFKNSINETAVATARAKVASLPPSKGS